MDLVVTSATRPIGTVYALAIEGREVGTDFAAAMKSALVSEGSCGAELSANGMCFARTR